MNLQFHPVSALTFVKEAISLHKDTIVDLRRSVQVFCLESDENLPKTLMIQRDVFCLLLHNLLGQTLDGARRGIAIFVIWKPSASRNARSKNESMEKIDPVLVVNWNAVEVNEEKPRGQTS